METQGKDAVFAAKAVEWKHKAEALSSPQGKGAVFAAKAAEAQGRGGVFATRQWKHKAEAVSWPRRQWRRCGGHLSGGSNSVWSGRWRFE